MKLLIFYILVIIMNSSNLQLGDFVSNIEQPLLLTNYLKWDIINWDISKWNEILGNENLVFRYGWYAKTQVKN